MIRTNESTMQVWRGDSLLEEDRGPVSVSHVVDFYRRYPGEVLIFYTRIKLHEDVSSLILKIALPEELILGDYHPPPEQENLVPYFETEGEVRYLIWSLDDHLSAGQEYEYRTETVVEMVPHDVGVESQAVVMTENEQVLHGETVTVDIFSKGKYLEYLPALYERDELMGRFLMLFESFWKPIQTQISDVHYYFDPRITPVDFLPWLASWLDLDLDDRWPEERLRQLIRWAIALHRSRGTKWGLLKYLEIYTGEKAKVIERRSKNFVLGSEARMGPGIALGRKNQPHTFTVRLHLPPLEIEEEAEQERQEKIRERTIRSIIEMQKPAHTVYSLELEIISPEEERESESDGANEESDNEIDAQAAIWFKLD